MRNNDFFLIFAVFLAFLPMPIFKFIIRMNIEEPQTVYVTARFGRNEKLMYATPLKVERMFWDSDRQRVKPSRYCPYRDSVNYALDGIADVLGGYIMETTHTGGAVTKETLREVLDVHFGKARRKAGTFHEFFREFIETNEQRVNSRRGGQSITYRTKRRYICTLEYIKEYEGANGKVLEFDDIDTTFLESFVAFLQTKRLATNTIANKVSDVKAVMGAAFERGVTTNARWKSFKKATEQSDAVALDGEELERIRKCNLSRHPRLARIRDLFLMECWTGLRFSDIMSLCAENIKDDVIVIQQRKTDSYVTVPVHPVFREIWERYGGIPIQISNQKFNKRIKDVCKAARINAGVIKSITKGGRRETAKYRKWELVSSHTGRRSFATNLYKSGFPSISIMSITGHKSESAFLKYIKVGKEEHVRMLSEHWRKESKKTNVHEGKDC